MPFSKRRSLAIKIPLLMSLLLIAALAAMSIASYLELRTALMEMATARLQQAGDQISGVFSMSARQRINAMKELMARPELRQFLRTRDASLQPTLDAAIRAYLGPALPMASVELWDAGGKRIFTAGTSLDEVPAALLDDYKNDLHTTNEPAIGRIREFSDGLRYPVGGQIVEGGQMIGYVVERRRITNPAQTRLTVSLLTGLIGNQATMVIGNADNSTWTDLVTPIKGLPVDGRQRRLWEYVRPGAPRSFAWSTPISSTPWAVAIEFPRAVVLEPSQRFIFRSLAIAGVVLLAAAAVGWVTTRRITTPLRQVTEAAEAVAESRPHVPIAIDRKDEIGRLADSFNIMAAKVEQGRAELESRVEQRTAELRAANRELEAFSYSVSHDLRAPLRAIAGFVQILEDDHAAHLDDAAKRHLDRVKVNARRMGQLIDDLLSFSQIGRSTLLLQAVDLGAMAKSVADEAAAASGRAIDVRVEPLPPCHGEPSLLNQVLVNLISNSIKFTAKVPEPSIVIGSTIDNGETVYFVRDNGVGFDSRYAEKLFGVFQRLHRPDEFEGTGVGLAIVHRIVSRHGGRVWAEGKINGGATFYFTLPSSAKATEGKPA